MKLPEDMTMEDLHALAAGGFLNGCLYIDGIKYVPNTGQSISSVYTSGLEIRLGNYSYFCRLVKRPSFGALWELVETKRRNDG